MQGKRFESRLALGLLALACSAHLIFSFLLSVNSLGLQYDEAISFKNASQIVNSAQGLCDASLSLRWGKHCIPLMLAPYVGVPKDYMLLPVFALFGVHIALARGMAALLSCLLSVGIFFFLRRFSGPAAAYVSLALLAIHPSLLMLPLFDSINFAVSCGVLGLLLFFISRIKWDGSALWIFLTGFAAGLGVWARLNFSWVLASGFVAWLLVYRPPFRTLIRQARYAAPGALLGVFPLILYLSKHFGDLRRFMAEMSVTEPFPQHLINFKTSLLFVMFNSVELGIAGVPPTPPWAVSLITALLIVSSVIILVSKNRLGICVLLWFLLLSGFFLQSKLPVAEHHLIILVPLAAMLVSIGLQQITKPVVLRWVVVAFMAFVVVAQVSTHLKAIHFVRVTGGRGMWSSGILDAAKVLDKIREKDDVPMYALDWGFAQNIQLLTAQRIRMQELYSPGANAKASDGRSWKRVVHDGGVFITFVDAYLNFPLATLGFRNALGASEKQIIPISTRDGAPLALIYRVPKAPSDVPVEDESPTTITTSFFANPQICKVSGTQTQAETVLIFTLPKPRSVEIHIGAPNGPIFSRFRSVSSGVAQTGPWVTDGMTFYLQDISDGPGTTAKDTIATTSVRVERADHP